MADAQFVTAPEVRLISRPLVDRGEIECFLHDAGFPARFAHAHAHDAEQAIAAGSRTCYQSFDSGRPPDEHLAHIIEVGHGSVLEHATFGVLVAGISRSCSHELVRHRHLSPSQLSQRYVDQSAVRFVVPPALLNRTGRERWEDFCRSAAAEYGRLADDLFLRGLAGKPASEAARSVLPNCTETRMLLTGNLRAWRGFFEKRCSAAADAEIRRLACAILEVIRPHSPAVFADYERHPLPDGTFEVRTAHRGV